MKYFMRFQSIKAQPTRATKLKDHCEKYLNFQIYWYSCSYKIRARPYTCIFTQQGAVNMERNDI